LKCLFEIREAGVRYGSADVLSNASLKLYESEFVAIAGPNGAGKSTLLSLIAGLAKPTFGQCLFEGHPAHGWNRREFARRVAVVLQTEPTAFPFTVSDVVAMGRLPHATGLYENGKDTVAIAEALCAVEMERFRHRDFRTLSSGEKQRVLLAAALAQEPQVLLLDEPSSHLDLEHQLSLHRRLRELSGKGLLVVSVTHDLNLAAAYAERIVLLKEGTIRADGPPSEVLSADLLEAVFHVHVKVHQRASGQPWMLYGE